MATGGHLSSGKCSSNQSKVPKSARVKKAWLWHALLCEIRWSSCFRCMPLKCEFSLGFRRLLVVSEGYLNDPRRIKDAFWHRSSLNSCKQLKQRKSFWGVRPGNTVLWWKRIKHHWILLNKHWNLVIFFNTTLKGFLLHLGWLVALPELTVSYFNIHQGLASLYGWQQQWKNPFRRWLLDRQNGRINETKMQDRVLEMTNWFCFNNLSISTSKCKLMNIEHRDWHSRSSDIGER